MAAPTLSGRRPPETMSRRGSTTPSASRQSKSSPDPGLAPSIINSWAPYSEKWMILGCPAGKALMVRPTLSAIHRVCSADSIPWSWTARNPRWLAMSMTRWGASSRKTPTVTISRGRRLTMSPTAVGDI